MYQRAKECTNHYSPSNSDSGAVFQGGWRVSAWKRALGMNVSTVVLVVTVSPSVVTGFLLLFLLCLLVACSFGKG